MRFRLPHSSAWLCGAILCLGVLTLSACADARNVAAGTTATPIPTLERSSVPSAVASASSTVQPQPAATARPSATPEPSATPMVVVPVRVFCAGSLMIPFAALEDPFEAANPDLDMEMEAHGSIQVIRHVTDIHEKIDVVASADHALLSQLMYGTVDPNTSQPYAEWNVRFATNRVVLAYHPERPGASEIATENWVEIISRPGMRIGLSDPRFDALGYRQLMILQLAEPLYGRKTLFEDVLMGRFAQPIRAVAEDEGMVIHVPELLDPRVNSTIVLRGSSIQLIPVLESGDVDYILEYASVAMQHGLSFVELPGALNLGDPTFAASSATVRVQLDFRRFASVEPHFQGERIAYGLTIPTNAPQPEAAARFVASLLGPEGRRIMAEHHHPLLESAVVDQPDLLPELLQPLCVAG